MNITTIRWPIIPIIIIATITITTTSAPTSKIVSIGPERLLFTIRLLLSLGWLLILKILRLLLVHPSIQSSYGCDYFV